MTVPNEKRRRAAVYRLYDPEGVLLYIGSAYDPEERCREHCKKPWWPEVASRAEEWFDSRGAAYVEEMKAVGIEKSKYNRMGTPSYRTPETDAVRRRRELAPLRQRLIEESTDVEWAARKAARDGGATWDESYRAGKLAGIEFLEATGLFAGAVKERRRRLAAAP